MTTRRPGFALVLSVVLVMALAVLAAGILVVGTREATLAGAVSRRTQAVRNAEAGVLAATDDWSTRFMADLPVGEQRLLDDDTAARTTAVRIDTALYLVRSEGRVPGPFGPATAQAAALVRTIPSDRLARSFPGALTATGSVVVAATGSIKGTEPPGPAAGTPCEGPTPGVVASAVSVAPGASISGWPAIDTTPPLPMPVVDPFGAMAAVLAGVRYPDATATPRAVAYAGTCVTDSLSWGSPDPGHPCHDALPMVSTSDLTVDGGHNRGILVVKGDLTMIRGARLEGLVVVHGQLAVEGGSIVRGAARTGSAAVVDGAIIRDGCAVRAALSAPSLDRAFRPPDRWWIPVF